MLFTFFSQGWAVIDEKDFMETDFHEIDERRYLYVIKNVCKLIFRFPWSKERDIMLPRKALSMHFGKLVKCL